MVSHHAGGRNSAANQKDTLLLGVPTKKKNPNERAVLLRRACRGLNSNHINTYSTDPGSIGFEGTYPYPHSISLSSPTNPQERAIESIKVWLPRRQKGEEPEYRIHAFTTVRVATISKTHPPSTYTLGVALHTEQTSQSNCATPPDLTKEQMMMIPTIRFLFHILSLFLSLEENSCLVRVENGTFETRNKTRSVLLTTVSLCRIGAVPLSLTQSIDRSTPTLATAAAIRIQR
jgi:hypothetical protein